MIKMMIESWDWLSFFAGALAVCLPLAVSIVVMLIVDGKMKQPSQDKIG